ncbi:MAG TPA: Fmu (Sun) domain-containing protein [Chitinophagaceae bacterium]|nr:Fmu (Sun) domain-containing protein [Chitinophagaceae bacterium]
MKHFSHLNTAVQLAGQYKGELPFSIFLKSFFAQHKKYGSRDRKIISHLCYCGFRLGKALQHAAIEERILTGLFLCDQQPHELLQHFKPGRNEHIHLAIEEKAAIAGISLTDIFPWKEELSAGIDHAGFCRSFLVQPDVFIRLRPGYEQAVKKKLQRASIGFKEINSHCLAVPTASKLHTVIDIDREAVIQDMNSQQTGTFFGSRASVWDCCAASGGKSILAHDLLPAIDLTVSDVRESIIINLKQRFARAGIRNYRSFVADLGTDNSSRNPVFRASSFDLIICDAPCSGSGTWSRTPEQLAFFNMASADHYAALQKRIAGNAITYLKKGGRLVYITCSVFKKENEDAVNFLTGNHAVELEDMQVLAGYTEKADTLFAASFIKTG